MTNWFKNTICTLAVTVSLAGVSCTYNDVYQNDQIWCKKTLETSMEVAKLHNLEGLKKLLNATDWCADKEIAFRDAYSIADYLEVYAYGFCIEKKQQLQELAKNKESPLVEFLLNELNSCKLKGYKRDIRAGLRFQQFIDAYKNKK